jgi:FkbM family methyltransferase
VSLFELVKTAAGEIIVGTLGRRNAVLVTRFLNNYARLDRGNTILENGETMVQETVIASFDSDQPLVVFDIGANIGRWTLQFLARSQARQFTVHAFEPVSATAEIFRKNVSHPNVILNQKALSDKAGTAQIAVEKEGAGTNAIVPDSRQPVKYRETVELTTVDDYCRLNGITQIGLLKVDAEGYDLFVLRGAKEMLGQKRIRVVQFEYNHRWIWSRAFLMDAFELAGQTGYRLGKVTRHGIEFYKAWDQELEKFQEGNYILCDPAWLAHFRQIRWWNE